ncbi:archease [Candidatus Woesearchaeota archaeon]|nr:archease [Candidatus Woesearchaeota archaeon]
MKYKYLKHTADLKVRAFGKTLEEAFANAAIGGFDFLTPTSNIKKRIEKNISVSAKRVESLLYDFIEELLFLLDTEGFMISEFKDMRIKEDKEEGDGDGDKSFSLQCIALGDHYKNYEVKGDIKAITYSEMSIRKEKDKGGKDKGKDVFVVEAVFDI